MKTQVSTLKNGLTLASTYLPYVDSVSVNIWVKVGARYEDISNSGISHFLEHMAFKGTKTRDAKKIAEEFDYIGGAFNAYTSYENTVYYIKTLKDNLHKGFDILSDILLNSTYDNEEFERERGVILQEIAETYDSPDDYVFEMFQEKAFGNQPLGRSILGSKERITNTTRDQIISYVNTHYHGKNMAITAAGNIQHHELEDYVNKYFANIRSGEENLFEKAVYQGGLIHENRDLEQVHLVLGLEGNNYRNENYYTQFLMGAMLGGGMSSRLFQEVREKRGLAYTISSASSFYRDTGVFYIYTSCEPQKMYEMVDVIAREIKKAASEFSAEELDKVRSQSRSVLLMAREGVSYLSESLGRDIVNFGRPIPKEEIISKIDSITIDDIRSSLNGLMTSKPCVSAVGPIQEKDLEIISELYKF